MTRMLTMTKTTTRLWKTTRLCDGNNNDNKEDDDDEMTMTK